MLPLNVEGPARIQVLFPCRFLQKKDPGQAFISVLVATLSMFSGGWALFTLIATSWTKRGDETGGTMTVFEKLFASTDVITFTANRCIAHHTQYHDLNSYTGLDEERSNPSLYNVAKMV
jgi:hypothetical protein